MSSSKFTRSKTPPAIPTISVSEFVRGGLYQLDKPTTVMSHSEELGTWYPKGQGVTANYYSSIDSSTVDMLGASSSVSLGGGVLRAQEPVNVKALNEAVRQMQEFLRSVPGNTEGEETDK